MTTAPVRLGATQRSSSAAPVLFHNAVPVLFQCWWPPQGQGHLLAVRPVAWFIVSRVRFKAGGFKVLPQQGEISYAPVIKKEDGLVNWNSGVKRIYNKIKTFYP